ncbi:MAG: DUF4240 domain-containing protein [Candidatus Obscuribacter sp.]|nr:DUF4240 domain-containing protein [Candidatus Obscuribacter sp.]MBK9280801.1 DUF4240 domain-containing protein [Candidatus Obscuribacter sp.]MBL8081073.1 DUF4240 domain-containing protein [Candidatus Obscuribacter sp.]HMY55083.1 DUF4240 domain-containing protein [Candidatus Obscuribacter sp.]
MKLSITARTYNSNNEGDFPALANYLAIGLPALGHAVKLLSIEPHFDVLEPKYALQSLSERFKAVQKRLPEVIFSRKNRNITFRYNSKVCTGDDLRSLARVVYSTDCVPGSVSIFHNYCKELYRQLLILEKHLEPADDFDVQRLREHIKKRQSELSRHPAKLKEQLKQAKSAIQMPEQDLPESEQDVPTVMSDDKFWRLMRLVQTDFLMNGHQREAIEYLDADLRKLSSDELCAFQRNLKSKLAALDTKEHFRYADKAQTDDSFLYLRLYIIGMGEEFYTKTLMEPRFTPSGYEDFQLLYYAASHAWAFVTSDVSSNFPHH